MVAKAIKTQCLVFNRIWGLNNTAFWVDWTQQCLTRADYSYSVVSFDNCSQAKLLWRS